LTESHFRRDKNNHQRGVGDLTSPGIIRTGSDDKAYKTKRTERENVSGRMGTTGVCNLALIRQPNLSSLFNEETRKEDHTGIQTNYALIEN